jgi:hypothetical protein
MIELKYKDLPEHILAHPTMNKDRYDIVGIQKYTTRLYLFDLLKNGYEIKERQKDGVLLLSKIYNPEWCGKIELMEV